MYTSSEIADLMHQHNRTNKTFKNTDTIPFDKAYDYARSYINNNAKKADALKDGMAAKKETIRLIDDFVNDMSDKLKLAVEGYTDDGGLARLRNDLKEEIVNYKAITELMSNEGMGKAVTEIRINSHKSIIYEMDGKTYIWPKTFKSPEELLKVLNKLLGDEKRLTRSTPFMNSSTLEGYRINATDKSISRNGDDYTAVIRKFRDASEKLQIDDIVKYRSLSDNMATLLDILPKARFSFLTVGGTGSGKTVTNEIIVRGIRPMDRQIYIENPCELTPGVEGVLMTLKEPDETARFLKGETEMENFLKSLTNNHTILSYSPDIPLSKRQYLVSVSNKNIDEARYVLEERFGEGVITGITEGMGFLNDYIQMQSNSDKKDPSATDPTPNNLVENALRQTPIWIVVGETRSDEEFKVLLKAAQTGHRVITTFHAEDPQDAIRRYLMAYLSVASNVPYELVLQNICSSFKFIINVEKLHDGSRRVMYITEILGSEGTKPLLSDIYRYEIETVDENGTIIGKHKRVGKLSEASIKQLKKMGIPDIRYKLYRTDPTDDEEEAYNGLT